LRLTNSGGYADLNLPQAASSQGRNRYYKSQDQGSI
jgi:hypothetical protein